VFNKKIKIVFFRYKESKEAPASVSTIPVIAPQLRIPSSKVEDLQLCYAVQIPNGKYLNLFISN
jgi:hypothetical protein